MEHSNLNSTPKTSQKSIVEKWKIIRTWHINEKLDFGTGPLFTRDEVNQKQMGV